MGRNRRYKRREREDITSESSWQDYHQTHDDRSSSLMPGRRSFRHGYNHNEQPKLSRGNKSKFLQKDPRDDIFRPPIRSKYPFITESQNFKRHLINSINSILSQIEQWYPDQNGNDDAMDWQYENEVVIPQPQEVQYRYGEQQQLPVRSIGIERWSTRDPNWGGHTIGSGEEGVNAIGACGFGFGQNGCNVMSGNEPGVWRNGGNSMGGGDGSWNMPWRESADLELIAPSWSNSR